MVHLFCQLVISNSAPSPVNMRCVTKKLLLVITETVQVSCLRGNSAAEASGGNNLATAAELH